MENVGIGTYLLCYILNMFQQFGLFYGPLIYFLPFWYFSPFWYVVPRRIWQPWFSDVRCLFPDFSTCVKKFGKRKTGSLVKGKGYSGEKMSMRKIVLEKSSFKH
jgi:hypothetical protein